MKQHNQSDHVGVPSFSIPENYLKAALNLLIIGTDSLKQKSFVFNQKENEISIALVGEMQKEQEKYNIRADILTPNLIYSCKGIEYSEIDIRFTWDNYSPNAYFAVEAKRLFGKGDSLAGKYVEGGVMDFVDGKYSLGHSYGIMMGYILSEPINNAILAVKKALKKRIVKTNEISHFDTAEGLVDYSLIFKSVHIQKNNKTNIIILHMFFDLSS